LVFLTFDNHFDLVFTWWFMSERNIFLQLRRNPMTLQRALLLLVLMMGLGLMIACGDDDDDADSGTDSDADTDTDTDADAGEGEGGMECAETCPDISPGAPTWSCRATSYDMGTCTDYPKLTWSEADALTNCQASADMGGGTVDSWSDTNCAVDNFDTTWRCIATSDADGILPTYYTYAETMPKGICGSAAALTGVVEDRPADCCWTDADYPQ
jgi:hypothetical protein